MLPIDININLKTKSDNNWSTEKNKVTNSFYGIILRLECKPLMGKLLQKRGKASYRVTCGEKLR